MTEERVKQLREIHSLLKNMGENISDSGNMLLYANNAEVPFILEEGLIKSYPIENIISFIGKAFNLKNQYEGLNLATLIGKAPSYKGLIYKEEDTSNQCERIIIRLYEDIDLDKLNHYMKKYGWFLSRTQEDKLYFEKKYDETAICYQLIAVGVTKLYHITNSKNIPSIQKKGLLPKEATNPNGYMNGERVYLFLNKEDEFEIKMIYGNEKLTTITIDLRKINPQTRFYFDPRLPNCLYTHEPISPNALEYDASL